MVKIIRIITRLNIGGPAIHTTLLSSELNKKGNFKDILLCGKVSASEGDMEYFAREKGVEPIVISEMGRDISIFKDIGAFFNILGVIKREKPDIVHTHTAKAGALGRIAAIFAGVPVKVHTFHGHIFDGYFSPAKAKFFLIVEKILALFTDRIITVSERVEDEVIDRLKVAKRSKSRVIPLGLELDKFDCCGGLRGRFRGKLGIKDGEFLVGIVGRLVPIKNHKMFLDAAKIAKEKNPSLKVRFIIVGDGELRGHLEEYSKSLSLERDVIFTGWIEDLPAVYADLDVVTLTSLNEGTPVSLIEAAAAGKPIIATDVGGVRDAVKNGNGILVRSQDAKALAAGIVSILENPQKAADMARDCKRSAIELYSKSRLIRDMENLYEELTRQVACKRGGKR